MAHDREDGRGLAGAVRSQQGEDLTRIDRERQVADRDHLAIAAGEVPNLEQRHGALSGIPSFLYRHHEFNLVLGTKLAPHEKQDLVAFMRAL